MTKRIWNVVLVLACLLGFQSARAEFKDIRVDLTNGNLLTFVAKDLSGITFNGQEASVVWAFNSQNFMEEVVVAPEGAFSNIFTDRKSVV